jgi:Eukaryotic aspartyl protease
MDTGSSNFWVPGKACSSIACNVHTTLGSSDSTTLNMNTITWAIQYGTGLARGVGATDSVSIGGLTVSNMTFGVATLLSNDFVDLVLFIFVIFVNWSRQMGFSDWGLQVPIPRIHRR